MPLNVAMVLYDASVMFAWAKGKVIEAFRPKPVLLKPLIINLKNAEALIGCA